MLCPHATNETQSDMVDYPEFNRESLDAWDDNATYWDERQGDDGNHWQRTLVFPPTLELLRDQSGELPQRLLEIACGNGAFARQLARLGVSVTATDGAESQLERARERSSEVAISWRRVDATDASQLASLADAPDAPFDAVVCNMALMDIAEISPIFDTLPLALADDAPLVFSVLHPAFNSGPSVRLYRERLETPDGRLVEESGVRISGYLKGGVQRGIAVVGQPTLQPYFQRPLSDLFGAAFDAGWVLDGLREPAIIDGGEGDADGRLSWDHLPDIPPVLVARLRHRGARRVGDGSR